MKIHLGGYLAFFVPGRKDRFEIVLPQPTPLIQIINRLALPKGEIAFCILNDEAVDPEIAMVANQDILQLYSAHDGG